MVKSSSKLLATILLAAAGPLAAWTTEGHRLISSAALQILDPAVGDLDSAAMAAMVEATERADLMRPKELPQLRDREAPEHYLDLERLQGQPLPSLRSEYLKLVSRMAVVGQADIGPNWTMEAFGTLPYAIVESTQRLAVAFALMRQRPKDRLLRSFAMYEAGHVAHYAQDLSQPLHTTIHHDGRVPVSGVSPRSGIHRSVDGLLDHFALDEKLLHGGRSQRLSDLFAAVVDRLHRSHALVDQVYSLEPDLQALEASGQPSAALESFARERFVAATSLTADLIDTAWHLSATMELPDRPRAKSSRLVSQE